MHCGHDANSRFGTKVSGLKQLAISDLYNLGKDLWLNYVEDMLLAAEKYLVTVLKPNSPCKSMDDLRYHIYHHSKSQLFVDLPQTTFETRGHCLMAIYNTYQYIYAIVSESMQQLNPVH